VSSDPSPATGLLPTTDRRAAPRGRVIDRRVIAFALAGAALLALTTALVHVRATTDLATVALLFLLPVVIAAVVGGLWPALATAMAADLTVNFFFVPPTRHFSVEQGNNVLVLAVYVAVAVTVALAVDVAARQRATAARRALDVALLAASTSGPVTAESLTQLLEQVRDTFALHTVTLLEQDEQQGERVVAQIGADPHGEPSITTASVTGGLRIRGWGPALFAEDRRVLDQLAQAAARTLHAQRLAAQAAQARELAQIDRVRTALLTAVGHDLRTPLAGIKAAVSSLRQDDIDFAPADEAELLATIEESTDALTALVENLLDMSRLQAGVLSVHLHPMSLDAVVAEAIQHTGTIPIEVDVPEDLPLALVDPGLLERVLSNLLLNAHTAHPSGPAIQIRARTHAHRLLLQVIDHGPGITAADHERIFTPFQRLDDHGRGLGHGLGLGLALARGFAEAMNAALTPTQTPGGGLTMTLDLPTAPPAARAPSASTDEALPG
jgi:K+-sensing histidine kinase KdpD